MALGKTKLFKDVDEVTSYQGGTWDIGTLGSITGVVHIDDNSGSLTVDGTVAATQSGTWDIGTIASITADVSIDDGGNSITIDALDLDIRDLSHVSDSIKIGDGTNLMGVNADGSINVQGALDVTFAADGAIAQAAVTVPNTNTAVALPTLAAKKFMIVQNAGSKDCFIGNSAVAITDGLLLRKGADVLLESASAWYAICAGTDTTELRVVENA